MGREGRASLQMVGLDLSGMGWAHPASFFVSLLAASVFLSLSLFNFAIPCLPCSVSRSPYLLVSVFVSFSFLFSGSHSPSVSLLFLP